MKKYIIDENVRNNLTVILNNGIYSIRHGEVANMMNALIKAEEYKENLDLINLINDLEEELSKSDEENGKLKEEIEALKKKK